MVLDPIVVKFALIIEVISVLAPDAAAPKFVLAVDATDAPVPPFATDKSVPLQSELLIAKVPPNVKLPEVVTVPVNVSPFLVPVPPTDNTVPPGIVYLQLLQFVKYLLFLS